MQVVSSETLIVAVAPVANGAAAATACPEPRRSLTEARAFNIRETAFYNDNYRWVTLTTSQAQFAVMSLQPGEETGAEVHKATQFVRIEFGQAKVVLDGECSLLDEEGAVWVPPGTVHNIINVGDKPLKLYTIYAPPVHRAGLIEAKKPESRNAGLTSPVKSTSCNKCL